MGALSQGSLTGTDAQIIRVSVRPEIARHADENESGAGAQADIGPEHSRRSSCCGAHSHIAQTGHNCHRELSIGTTAEMGQF